MARFPRLDLLLGAPVEKWEEAELARAVELGLAEDADLDFKREPHTKSEEIGKDVAALANAGGGVLIIGVADEGNRAHQLQPFPFDTALEQKVRGSVADLVAPVPLGLSLRWVVSATTPGAGYLLIMVPLSPDAPHALRGTGGSPKLSYPTRDGDHTRYLAEAEIAARYRNRFARQGERRERLAAVEREGWEALLMADRLWLSLTLVPEQAGQAVTGRDGVDQVQDLAVTGNRFPSPLQLEYPTARVGLRRVSVSGRLEPATRKADHSHAELHADGSGFVAIEFSGGLRSGSLRGEAQNIVGIPVRHLEAGLAAGLQLLVEHAAARARCGGDAALALRVHAGEANGMWHHTVIEPTPVTGDARRLAGAAHRHQPAALSTVISLDAVAGSAQGLLVTSHLIALDVLSVFGVAPDLALQPDGSVQARRFGREEQAVRRWAEEHGVPLR